MNRKLISIIIIFSHFAILGMEIDDDYDIVFFDAPRFSQNPARVYNSDLCMRVTENLSKYELPMDAQLFESEDIQRKFQSINNALWPHHLRITFSKRDDIITAVLNQAQTSAINSGEEELVPFHEIAIPLGKNVLNEAYNKKLIEKRLHELHELALEFQHNKNGGFDRALENYRRGTTFSTKMKFQLTHKIKPQIERQLGDHIGQTLALPFHRMIDKYLAYNPTAHEEHEIEILNQKLESHEPMFQRILKLNQKHNDLKNIMKNDKPDTHEIQSNEEDFITQFESITSFLANSENS